MVGQESSEEKRIHDLDPGTLYSWLQTGQAVVVDVREFHEHAVIAIEGCHLHPLSSFDPRKLPKAEGEKKLVFVCKAGVRSKKAAKVYSELGACETYHLAGGMDAWKQSDLPIQSKVAPGISSERKVQLLEGALIAGFSLLAIFHQVLWATGSLAIGAYALFAGWTGFCPLTQWLDRQLVASQSPKKR